LDCTIINFDEVSFRLVPVLKRVWAVKGAQPLGWFWWSNKKANLFGALIDGRELYNEWYDKLNATNFIAFPERFIKTLNPEKKYVFIFDNAPAHKAKITIQYLTTLSNHIFVEFLPTYSPQLNAIETCWKIVRYNVTNSNLFQTLETLKQGIEQFLQKNNFTLKPTNYLIR